jgi:hypothetical protein
MAEIIQRQDPEKFPSNITGNVSPAQLRKEDDGPQSRTDHTAIRKATGPRTSKGKDRSKFNARKHGLLSKAVLLQDESRAEYGVLLNGLIEDCQPQGKLEAVLVENLAAVLWRKRRLFQAETKEIEKAKLQHFDLVLQNKAGELQCAQLGGSSDVKLGQGNLRTVLRDAIEIFNIQRLIFMADDPENIESIRRNLEMMFGCEMEGPQPYSWRQMSLILSKLVTKASAKRNNCEDQPDAKKMILETIGEEILRLTELHDDAVKIEALRNRYSVAGPSVPPQAVSEHLMRYEAHLSREIDRILCRLERLQRIRKGQPLPPQVDVKIS